MHRDVDVVALPRGLPAQQRHQDAREALQGRHHVGGRHCRDCRLAVAALAYAEHAAHRFHAEVMRWTVAVGTALAERAD
jgi:hypothetical protein